MHVSTHICMCAYMWVYPYTCEPQGGVESIADAIVRNRQAIQRCIVLQCIALCCSVLHCVAVYCIVYQCGNRALQCHKQYGGEGLTAGQREIEGKRNREKEGER